jgi:sarcosine oxidase subunit alpha
VIGAGPAGLQAALTAANAGAKVLLIEQQPVLGGSLTYARFDIEGTRAETCAANCSAPSKARQYPVLTDATCNAWFTDNYLPVIQGKRMYKVRHAMPGRSGSFDQPVIFRNNDLPGVMLTSAAQRLMKLYAVKPGKRAVVLTVTTTVTWPRSTCTSKAWTWQRWWTCAATPPTAPAAGAGKARRAIAGSTVFEALHEKGMRHVSGVTFARSPARARSPAAAGLDCDLLCMSGGYMPVYQLLCQAGGKLAYDDQLRGVHPQRPAEKLTVAGSVNGRHALDNVLADATHAAAESSRRWAWNAARPLALRPKRRSTSMADLPAPQGQGLRRLRRRPAGARHRQRHRHRLPRCATGQALLHRGHGPVPGRHSALPTARLVAASTQRSISETGVTTARPPFEAEKLAHVAGRAFDPYRQTPCTSAMWKPGEDACRHLAASRLLRQGQSATPACRPKRCTCATRSASSTSRRWAVWTCAARTPPNCSTACTPLPSSSSRLVARAMR